MKFTAEPTALKVALQRAQRGVGKSAIPALGRVLLDVQDGRVVATGSDLDVTVRADAPCDTGETGRVLVDARQLVALLGHGAGTAATFAEDGGMLHVECGPVTAQLELGNPDDYPRLDLGASPEQADVDGFAAAIGEAAEWASVDPARPAFGQVWVSGRWVYATDSYRLIMLDLGGTIGEGQVSGRAARLATAFGGEWGVHAGDRSTTLVGDRWAVTARHVEAAPPTVEQCMSLAPVDGPAWFEVGSVDLFVERVQAATATSVEGRVRVVSGGGRVFVESLSGTASRTTVVTDAVAEKDAVSAFQAEYLCAALRAAGNGTVVRMGDPLRPATFDRDGARIVLMPVRGGA